MKSTLAKSVVQHIIAENQNLKQDLLCVKRDLKKIEDKMIQALDHLSLTYSTKLNTSQNILLFDSPYQCLTAFIEEISKIAVQSISTAEQNQSLIVQNRKLQYRNKQVQNLLKQTKIIEQQTVKSLNKQIQAKKSQLSQLQVNYQQLLKHKQIAEKQLSDTKQHMKILRLKLYEQQREKLTQIIVANKKQMIDFRRSLQMEAYKQELQFKKIIEEKEIQIRTLTNNIEEVITGRLTHHSDLTVLQKIVEPIRDTRQLKNQIVLLKKQLDQTKQQSREKHSSILQLEGKVASLTMNKQNLTSHNERLAIQKNLLTHQLKQTKKELEKATNDRKALDLYYSQKWHSQFSKVKGNLQEKFIKKTQQLQRQFQKKRKSIEAQIQAHVERIKVMKIQVSDLKKQIQNLLNNNKKLQQENNNQRLKNAELFSSIKQSEIFQNEQIRMRILQFSQKLSYLQEQNSELANKNRYLQFEIGKVLAQKQISEKSYLSQKIQQIERISSNHRKEIQVLKRQHRKQISQLQKSYSNMKLAIQEAKLGEKKIYEIKQKQILECQTQKIKEVQSNCQAKIKKINQKLSESQSRYQKLRRTKEQQLHYINDKLQQAENALHLKYKQLISKDVELEEYKKMRETYMGEIARLNTLLNEEVFLKKSLSLQLQNNLRKLQQKQNLILQLESKKYTFKAQLQQFQKLYKKLFLQLQQTHKKITAINKRKIKQLETLFQQRPIKPQHFEKIKSLEKTNSQLRTQIHIKEAENVILNQVKEYYEQRAFYGTPALGNENPKVQAQENSIRQELLSTCTFLKTANSFMRPNTNQGGYSFVKKYRNRKNKLITSSYNKFDAFQQEEKSFKQQSTDINRMRRYLLKQHNRSNGMASQFKKGEEVKLYQRTKSSIC